MSIIQPFGFDYPVQMTKQEALKLVQRGATAYVQESGGDHWDKLTWTNVNPVWDGCKPNVPFVLVPPRIEDNEVLVFDDRTAVINNGILICDTELPWLDPNGTLIYTVSPY